MPLSQLEGQPRALAQLRSGIVSGRLHHAYLFAGPSGVGKADAALRFAQAVNCAVDVEGCGRCESCIAIARGSHPDLLTLVSGGLDGPSRDIKVQQVRELCASLQLNPVVAARKVARILDADRMNPSAQNALLKTLEEPPSRTILILVTSSEDQLLGTVRSRCLRIPFAPLPLAVLRDRLVSEDHLPLPEARWRAALALGSLERARGFDDGSLGRRRESCAEVSRLLASQAGSAQALIQAMALGEKIGAERERAVEWLGAAAWYLRDLLLLAGGASPEAMVHHELSPELASGVGPGAPRVLAGLAAVGTALEALKGNGSPRLQLERACLRLAGVAA
jgi:DNA polymerase III subunit delta'